MKPRGIVVHLSASAFGDAAAVRRWHRERGFADIGYHAVILNGVKVAGRAYDQALDGVVQAGRAETVVGAHCQAKGMNRVTLGVCCIGTPGFPPAGAALSPLAVLPYLTQRQEDALVRWLAARCRTYKLDPLGRFTHNGYTTDVISQHSMHDTGKPLCASLHMLRLRERVALAMRALP